MSDSQIAGLGLIAVALLLGAIASFFYLRSRKFLSRAVAATGTVVGLVARPGSEGAVYAPRVQFTTADGQTCEFESSVGTSAPRYEVGAGLSVLYDPANPRKAKIESWFGLWFVPTLLGGIAAVFGLAGLLVLVAG